MEQGHYLTPFQQKLLLKSMEADLRPEYRRRIEIMLLADTGQSQAQICKTLRCSQETARYWIAVAQTGQAHNWNDCPMGRPKAVSEQYLARLQELVSNSPREYGYSFQRWTAQWLSKHLAKELGIEVSDRHINRLLKQMGLSTRPKSAAVEESIQTYTSLSKENKRMAIAFRRTIALGITLATLLVSSSTAQALPYDGTSPVSTGCSRDARTVRSSRIIYNREAWGLVELRYSPTCRTAWARLRSYLPGCIPGDNFCGSARVIRTSDNRSYSCSVNRSGQTTCYTPQVNDANVTSYAWGCLDNGPYTRCAGTTPYRIISLQSK